MLPIQVAPCNFNLKEETSSRISEEDIDDKTLDDDEPKSTTTDSRPLWVRQWHELRDANDPVIDKSAEALADMSSLAARLRELRRKQLG